MPSNNGDTDKIPTPRDHLADVTRDGLNSANLPSTTLRDIREGRENPPPEIKSWPSKTAKY